MRKAVFYFMLMITLLFLSSNIYSEASTISNDDVSFMYNASRTVAPQGSQVDMIYFKVTSKQEEIYLQNIRIKNVSRQGNTAARLFYDKDPYGVFGDEDTEVGLAGSSQTWTGLGEIGLVFDAGQSIATGEAKEFFVVYDISETAAVFSSVNVSCVELNYTGGGDTQLDITSATNRVTISGFTVYKAYDITELGKGTGVAVPGQLEIPMLRLNLKIDGESVDGRVSINIYNEAENFQTDLDSTEGIVGAKLYKHTEQSVDKYDPGGEYLDNYTFVAEVDAGEFISDSELEIGFDTGDRINFPEETTLNLFIVYEVGEDFQVTDDSKAYAKLTSVKAMGGTSVIDVVKIDDEPDQEAAYVDIGGLSYSGVYSIVPKQSSFGSGTTAPMMKLILKAYQIPVSINAFVLENGWIEGVDNGYLPYITKSNGSDGIKEIYIYENANSGDDFDGVQSNSPDILVSKLDLTEDDGEGIPDEDLAIDGNNGGLAVVTMNRDIQIDAGSTKVFFIIYKFGGDVKERQGTTINISTKALVKVRNVLGSSFLKEGVDSTEINLSGVLPAESSPESMAYFNLSRLNLIDVEDISPTTVVEGQRYVPMLYLKLDNDGADISSAAITISNPATTFSSINEGVSRVWIYKDVEWSEGVTPVLNIDVDEKVSVKDEFSLTNLTTLTGVEFKQAQNRLFVCYDIGQASAYSQDSSVIKCRLQNVTGSDFLFGGAVPYPPYAAECEAVQKYLSINSVLVEDYDPAQDLADVFTVQIKVANNASKEAKLTDVLPRFYKGGRSGSDISNEFTITPADSSETLPVSINANESVTLYFDVQHTSQTSDGTVFVDGYAIYDVPSGNAVISRYEDSTTWQAAAGENGFTIYVKAKKEVYGWTLPDYIEDLWIEKGSAGVNSNTSFVNGDAVRANSSMIVRFKNNGNIIDPGSIMVSLNGISLKARTSENPDADSFSYNRTDGEVRIPNLGERNGEILISVNDLEKQPMNDAYISFSISEKVVINDFLFYPNPYVIGEEDLKMGFSLTQPADVTFYLFNHLGLMVWSEEVQGSLGYNMVTIDKYSDFLSSGMYVCKMKAVDSDDNTSITVTRLAIY